MSGTNITRGTEREIAEFLAEYYGTDDTGGDRMTITDDIRAWAIQRDLHKADPHKQALKLGEEYGELCEGLAKGDDDAVRDALGDMYVVMTILAMQLGFSIEGCIAQAYDEIKDRRGVMRDGVFVKEDDLKAEVGDENGNE